VALTFPGTWSALTRGRYDPFASQRRLVLKVSENAMVIRGADQRVQKTGHHYIPQNRHHLPLRPATLALKKKVAGAFILTREGGRGRRVFQGRRTSASWKEEKEGGLVREL